MKKNEVITPFFKELFNGIGEAYKYAVVYTEVITKGSYFETSQWCGINIIERKYSNEKKQYENANFFQSLNEAKTDVSILKSISNKKYINIHIVKR